jgi:hypothetical protein
LPLDQRIQKLLGINNKKLVRPLNDASPVMNDSPPLEIHDQLNGDNLAYSPAHVVPDESTMNQSNSQESSLNSVISAIFEFKLNYECKISELFVNLFLLSLYPLPPIFHRINRNKICINEISTLSNSLSCWENNLFYFEFYLKFSPFSECRYDKIWFIGEHNKEYG